LNVYSDFCRLGYIIPIFVLNFQYSLTRITYSYNTQIYYGVICVAVYIMQSLATCNSSVQNKKTQTLQQPAQTLPVRTTAVERRLYDSLPEYWVITSKPQRILAARSNKLQQNPKPAEADERASCRA